MIIIQVVFVMLMVGVTLVAMLGCLGLLNLLVVTLEGGWRAHLAVWLGSVLVLCLMAVAMPRYIKTSPDGDRLIFGYEKPSAAPPHGR